MPRPKSFDPDDALAKAMDVFWLKGYADASISDLTEAMGINRFSLYDTFGDKHALYLQAFDSYLNKVLDPYIAKLASIGSMRELKSHLLSQLDDLHAKDRKPCCMITKAAASMAASDEETKARVDRTQTRIHGALKDLFARLKDQGDIRQSVDPCAAATLLMTTQAGLRSFAEVPLPKSRAKSAITMLLDQLAP